MKHACSIGPGCTRNTAESNTAGYQQVSSVVVIIWCPRLIRSRILQRSRAVRGTSAPGSPPKCLNERTPATGDGHHRRRGQLSRNSFIVAAQHVWRSYASGLPLRLSQLPKDLGERSGRSTTTLHVGCRLWPSTQFSMFRIAIRMRGSLSLEAPPRRSAPNSPLVSSTSTQPSTT
jgi:hypothetical protein